MYICKSIKPGYLSSNNNKNNNTIGVERAACDCRGYEPFTFRCSSGYRKSNEPVRRHFFLLTQVTSSHFNRSI